MIIKAALHALGQSEAGESGRREALADIDHEVARLNRIVNEVLDFSRPIRFDLAATDIGALCRESVAAAQASPGAEIAVDLDPALPAVVTDAERLRIALVNLLVNARHAVLHQPAGAEPLVTLSATGDNKRTIITITDRGVGMAPKDLAQVFDPYFTTKRGGTGLGLPIAKNIVEGLGGSVAVSSSVGQGTEMRIELPTRTTGVLGVA
jgi:two-component system sensor histidine kinase HydH